LPRSFSMGSTTIGAGGGACTPQPFSNFGVFTVLIYHFSMHWPPNFKFVTLPLGICYMNLALVFYQRYTVYYITTRQKISDRFMNFGQRWLVSFIFSCSYSKCCVPVCPPELSSKLLHYFMTFSVYNTVYNSWHFPFVILSGAHLSVDVKVFCRFWSIWIKYDNFGTVPISVYNVLPRWYLRPMEAPLCSSSNLFCIFFCSTIWAHSVALQGARVCNKITKAPIA